jgi:hypothetical protein
MDRMLRAAGGTANMLSGDRLAGRQGMRFEENRAAGWGVREFHNMDPPRPEPRPGHIDLGWSSRVVQEGTRDTTGRLEEVTVYYHVGRKRTFRGAEANRILRTVQENRADAWVPARI